MCSECIGELYIFYVTLTGNNLVLVLVLPLHSGIFAPSSVRQVLFLILIPPKQFPIHLDHSDHGVEVPP